MEARLFLVKHYMPFSFLFFLSLFSLRLELSEAQMVPAVFVFGDSLVDVGNNNHLAVSVAKANFPHNGIDFPTKKPTGRFCNGKNAADFIAEKVGLPSSPPYLSLWKKNNASYVNGVSFASGGAGIFNGTDQFFGQAIPLTKQVENYMAVHKILVQQMGSSAAENHFSKSIFAIIIGSNDLFDYFGSSNLRKKNSPQQFVELMTNTLKGQLKRLYAFGARKFFLAGIGAIGCIPAERAKNKTQECNEERNFWSVKYNELLKAMLNSLKSELQGVNYSYFDTYSIMQNLIQKPSAYGFNEIKAACCGLGDLKAKVPCVPISTYCSNRNDHVFWDLYHPTEATARIFADTLFDGTSQYSVPMNVRQLVSV
ncbi:GDSL esterase/lipase At5g55050-like [Durio zibethinus]|uniref:GDSL esterase/lipase At5g55050-like n=1 Tax=Durio zibethinus TaxID=66656 RepID=A0A6P5ZM90_DURZI|nr:GDSL esterase/lipase At5g55050-like [Durio zibethinus]